MDLTQFTPSSALITVIVVALAPFVGVMVTSFTKIIVVLSLLRNALGLQQVPPNVVLNGMALVLTVYVMLPVGLDMAERAKGVSNPAGSTAGLMSVADAAKEPLRDFLVKHSSPRERAFFINTFNYFHIFIKWSMSKRYTIKITYFTYHFEIYRQ